jgi:ABC-2 type transport system ATP-binding protein
MLSSIAEFDKVTKVYRSAWRPGWRVPALRGVSFTIEPGEIFAVVGPNRSGKTTLLKVLLGLCRPTTGQVFRLGRPLSERRTLARVGYLHENQAFPRYLTASQVLEYYGSLSGLSPTALRERVPALLETVGLTDRATDPIARFSKGMVQRLALAQSVVADPDLLVLDEPTEGLDLSAREVLREVLDRQRSSGKSVLMVSHALGEVARACDRLAVLVDGGLAFLGSLATLSVEPDLGGEQSLELALRTIYRNGSKPS